jgi:hypothetical protein
MLRLIWRNSALIDCIMIWRKLGMMGIFALHVPAHHIMQSSGFVNISHLAI